MNQVEKIDLPESPEVIRKAHGIGWVKAMLVVFGPGALIATITLGSGETIWMPRGIAIFGFTILWVYLYGAVFKWSINYQALRYTCLTGVNPVSEFSHIPGKKWFLWLFFIMLLLCGPCWFNAFCAILGEIMVSTLHIGSMKIWGPIILIILALMSYIGGLKIIEKVSTGIVYLLIILGLLAAIWVGINWQSFLRGLLPSIPRFPEWIHTEYPAIGKLNPWIEVSMYLGSLGGGMYDYIGYYGMYRDEKVGILGHKDAEKIRCYYEKAPLSEKVSLSTSKENIRRVREWLKIPLMDSGWSFITLILGTIGFLCLSGMILHPQHLVPAGFALVEYQSEFLSVISPYLLPIYWLGIFFAIGGTAYAGLRGYTYTWNELFSTLLPGKLSWKRIKPICYVYFISVALIMFFTGISPERALAFGATLGGVFFCGITGLGVVYFERKHIPKEFRSHTGLTLLTLISGIIFTIIGSYALYQFFVSL
jgi:Mn2+/Fe2+ NRAMP family transporter